MKIAGLDIGTTGCKLTVFDESGAYLDKAYRDYPVSRGKSEHEMDATYILDAVLEVMKEMAKKHPDVAGIGVTSFGETFVLADEAGKPLYPAILYTDSRGAQECEELLVKMDGKTIASITGVKAHETYSLPKIMWLRKHKPEIYNQAKHVFLMQDLVVFYLTGVAQIDYSMAARTMGLDITSLNWSRELFELAGVDIELMSKLVPTGTSAGCILKEIAEETGFAEKLQIISMSHDQVAASVGAGVFDSDIMVDGAGTVQCNIPVYDEIPPLDVMYAGNYAVVPYVEAGKYVTYAYSYTGGALIQWCMETLAKKEKEFAKEQGISVNELLEGNFSEPTGLLILPHFAGAATPYMDTGSKGAIIGLTTVTTVSEIYRACMEAVCYEMMLNMEKLKGSGIQFKMLHATGGGARSEVWMQMKADVLNVPVVALETIDAGTVGSAMMTGIALGCYKDLNEAIDCMVHVRKVYYPNAEMHAKYMEVYKRYRNLYTAVRPLVK